MITTSPQPETYSQLIRHSFKLYRKVFPHVFFLSLMLSIIAFIPRLLSVIVGQDIFLNLPPFSLYRFWLTLIDFGGLLFFTAVLWRIYCYLTDAHESMADDIKIALKKFIYIFVASLLQTLLVLGIVFCFVVLYFFIFMREGELLIAVNIADQLTLSLIFMSQIALVIYVFFLFYFYLPIILIENKGIFYALAKSAELVWKNWWRTFYVQLTPWLVYLICLLIVKHIFRIDVHIYFSQPEYQSLLVTCLHILLFAAFIPWLGTTLILQLRDLELRKNRVPAAPLAKFR